MSDAQAVGDLRKMIRGEVLSDDVSRALYSTDASNYEVEPLVVVLPKDKDDVIALVKYAFEHGIPLHPRGGGCGLAGQSLGPGIVIDFTKYMNRILEVNEEEDYVRVEPGLTLGSLNKELIKQGKYFPPDPSSGDYCSLGGMIANNSSGSHSVKYGCTIDYVISLEAALSNGEQIVTKPLKLDGDEYREIIASETLEASIYRRVRELLKENRELIVEKNPNVEKNCCGYRVERTIEDEIIDLAKLLVSSEGTLGIVVEAKLRIIDLPKEKASTLLHFDELEKACRAAGEILNFRPAAIEIMDRKCLDLIKDSYPEMRQRFPDEVDVVLLVEFDGATKEEIKTGIEAMKARVVDELGLAIRAEDYYEPSEQVKIWEIRKSVLPLLYNIKGQRQALAFVEDTVVDPSVLATYIREFYKILDKYGVDTVIYGHAGHGNLHARPLLNPKDSSDVEKMERVAEEVSDLIVRLRGTISGEHGDGLVRTQFVRTVYGDLFDLFREIKEVFDPKAILNPGKVVSEEEHLMTKNLRFGGDYKVVEDAARGSLLFSDEAFIREVELCHGCGKCRTQVKTTTMCPVFKVTLDEAMSPRGRGNLLRSIIKGRLGLDTLRSEEIRDLLFTCLNCKSCLVECPSEVNVPKLMLEAKARYVSEKGQERKNNFLVNIDSYARMGSLLASLSNSVLKNRTFRALAERIVGVDRRRSIPEFHGETFTKWYERHKTAGYSRRSESSRRVAYFVDTYANYNDPDLGRAVVEVLERNGFEVVVPDQIGSGLPAITYGSLDRARKIAERNVRSLAEVVKDGVKIVCSSPSAALALRDEYLDLLDSEEARIVAENTYEIGEFLLELYEKGELDTGFEEIEGVYAYHAPCHLKALGIGLPLVELLRKALGLDVRVLETGCCGLAGSFGFKKDYYDQSMEIGEQLFEEVRKSGAETVLTDCETCKLQIEHGSGVNVIFPIKLLRQAYQE